MTAAWSDENGVNPVQFTHDYAILPEDPNDLKGVIIVWDVISQVPAKVGSHSEVKPRIWDAKSTVLGPTATTSANVTKGVTVRQPTGAQWVYAQRFDCIVMFTIYADTWTRKYEYQNKFFDLMTSYAGVFKQTGLQELRYRSYLQEAMFDPPHNEDFPNQSILYDVRIERQTVVNYAVIQQVLLQAGIYNPQTGQVGDSGLISVVDGIPDSPVLPNSVNQS